MGVLTSPTPPAVEEGSRHPDSRPAQPAPNGGADRGAHPFKTGELVEVSTDSVRALARVRESSDAGRLHVAFEMGEYLPWVDAAVVIRLVRDGRFDREGADVLGSQPCVARARILHAGTSTALLQLLPVVQELPKGREPFDTLPLLEE